MIRQSGLLFVLLNAQLCLGDSEHVKKSSFQENISIAGEVSSSARPFSFAKHFDDHMVLQRSPSQAVVHGFHPSVGSKVYVRMVADFQPYYYTATTTQSPDGVGGAWSVRLDPMAADVTAVIEAVSEVGSLSISDVVFGDVWICSGQSNMEFTVSMMYGAKDEIANAHNYPNIRLMTAARSASNFPLYDLEPLQQKWTLPSADSLGGKDWTYFSAVCWLFGKGIHEATGVPIGLIDSDWGGTPIGVWSSPDALTMCNRTAPQTELGYVSGHDFGRQYPLNVNEKKSDSENTDFAMSGFEHFMDGMLDVELQHKEENSNSGQFRTQGKNEIKAKVSRNSDIIPSSQWFEDDQPLHEGRREKSGKGSRSSENTSDTTARGPDKDESLPTPVDDFYPQNDTVLWNAMIHPLTHTAIKGVVWYQGENDAYTKELMEVYNCTFPAMIQDWRHKFHKGSGGSTDPQFPFGFVQLSPWEKNPVNESGYPGLRWHQTADYGYVPNPTLPNVFMAVAIDLPDFHSAYQPVHPRHKKDVGLRLSLAGLSVAYNQTHVFQGPLPVRGESASFGFVLDYGAAWTLRIKNFGGFEFYCPRRSSLGQWVPTSILTWDDTTVTLYGSVCGSGRPSRLRYLWHQSPCEFKQCPVYSMENDLPAPPFIVDLFTDNKGRLRAAFNHTYI